MEEVQQEALRERMKERVEKHISSGNVENINIESPEEEREYLREIAGKLFTAIILGKEDVEFSEKDSPVSAVTSHLCDQICYHEEKDIQGVKDTVMAGLTGRSPILLFLAIWVLDTGRLTAEDYNKYVNYCVDNDLEYESALSMFVVHAKLNSTHPPIIKSELEGNPLDATRLLMAEIFLKTIRPEYLSKLEGLYNEMKAGAAHA